MNPLVVHETILGWIKSCLTPEQIAVAHDAVIKLYDQVYHAAGTQLSEELHRACIQRKVDIDMPITHTNSATEEIYNLEVPGKD